MIVKKTVLAMALTVGMAYSADRSEAAFTNSQTYLYGTGADMRQVAGAASLSDRIEVAKSANPAFADSFSLNGLGTLLGATLSVSHNGNFDYLRSDNLGEQWTVRVNGLDATSQPALSNSFYDWNTGQLITGWVTDTFTLSQSVINAINTDPAHRLTVSFLDRSSSTSNSFYLSSITLASETTVQSPVPLPAACLFFGSGLAGVALLRRTRE